MSGFSFFTNEAVSLDKRINLIENTSQTNLENIDFQFEISKCAEWIMSNHFQKVCLQFPDQMLTYSNEVCSRLQKLLNQTVYVLADTVYESCCIDYVAAAHINADAIIHYGPTCFSKPVASIPYLNVYEKYTLNLEGFKKEVEELTKQDKVVILVDTGYWYQFDDIVNCFKGYEAVNIHKFGEKTNYQDSMVVFLGTDNRKLRNLALSIIAKGMFCYQEKLLEYNVETQILKKRNYLIEKIKDSKTIGIIIGTVSVMNYIQIIERIKRLIQINFKKYYLISVGKPTVAKLANFPELDVYVAVTCSMSEIYDSRDFYKPIVTPYDIEMALNSNHDGDLIFSYDYNIFLKESDNLCGQNSEITDVSLLSNNVRCFGNNSEAIIVDNESQISLKADGTVASNSDFGVGYLSARSWQGLEQKLGQNEVELATDGRTGIAQLYKNELNL